MSFNTIGTPFWVCPFVVKRKHCIQRLHKKIPPAARVDGIAFCQLVEVAVIVAFVLIVLVLVLIFVLLFVLIFILVFLLFVLVLFLFVLVHVRFPFAN